MSGAKGPAKKEEIPQGGYLYGLKSPAEKEEI